MHGRKNNTSLAGNSKGDMVAESHFLKTKDMREVNLAGHQTCDVVYGRPSQAKACATWDLDGEAAWRSARLRNPSLQMRCNLGKRTCIYTIIVRYLDQDLS